MAQHRQICERAVFNGSFDDPRTLVYFYQQKMRGEIVAKIVAEKNRPSAWSVCLTTISSAFRWVTLPRPRLAQPVAVTSAA